MVGSEGGDRRQGVWTTVVDTTRRELRAMEAGPVTLARYSLVLLRFRRDWRRAQPTGPGRALATASSAG